MMSHKQLKAKKRRALKEKVRNIWHNNVPLIASRGKYPPPVFEELVLKRQAITQ